MCVFFGFVLNLYFVGIEKRSNSRFENRIKRNINFVFKKGTTMKKRTNRKKGSQVKQKKNEKKPLATTWRWLLASHTHFECKLRDKKSGEFIRNREHNIIIMKWTVNIAQRLFYYYYFPALSCLFSWFIFFSAPLAGAYSQTPIR